jgi:hypothetical protein
METKNGFALVEPDDELVRQTCKKGQNENNFTNYSVIFPCPMSFILLAQISNPNKPNALSHQSDHGDGKQDNKNIVLLKPELLAIRALEGLTVKGEEKDIVREIQKRNREGEVEL